MSAQGQLWSLDAHPLVVALALRDWLDGWVWHAVVVAGDEGSGYRVGDNVVVRPEALSQRWTVKPLTRATHEVPA